jgi:GAF domain-containing protein
MSDGNVQSSSAGTDALWQQTVLSEDANLQAALRRVAETGSRLLTNCGAASVTLIERGRPITVGSSNDTAQALDDAQYAAGEGPCLAAARENRVVRIEDTESDEQWPSFSASARANGIRSSLSIPIAVSHHDTVAGVNIYGEVTGGFGDADEQLGQAFAAQASIVVSNAQSYWGVFELSENLSKAMESRAVIEQAKGVLMSRRRIGADAAFDVLREISQASNRKLRDVAAEVVDKATRAADGA